MTLLNFFFGQSRLWKFLHGLVAVPVETVRFERSVHLFDCNTSWVKLNIVSLYKPVSLSKGPGKRGHIVADTLLPNQMLPRLPARATFDLCPGPKNVSDFAQKHFVSATNGSQFAQPKKYHGQQCVRTNVSSLARALRLKCCVV